MEWFKFRDKLKVGEKRENLSFTTSYVKNGRRGIVFRARHVVEEQYDNALSRMESFPDDRTFSFYLCELGRKNSTKENEINEIVSSRLSDLFSAYEVGNLAKIKNILEEVKYVIR